VIHVVKGNIEIQCCLLSLVHDLVVIWFNVANHVVVGHDNTLVAAEGLMKDPAVVLFKSRYYCSTFSL
jgi:hypothetical protein